MDFGTVGFFLIIVYLSTILMIWAIVIIEERGGGGVSPSKINVKPERTRKIIGSILGIDLRERTPIDFPSMEDAEIRRTCELLGLPVEDYLINNGLELDELINNSKTKRIRRLYNERAHDELQFLANYRILLDPEDLVPRVLLIKSLYITKNFNLCIERCNELLEREPRNIDGIRYLARARRSIGDEKGAFEKFMEISLANPEDVESLTGVARFFFIKKEYANALDYARDSLKIDPHNRTCLILQARIKERVRDYEGSIGSWEAVIGLNEEDLEGNLGKGKTLYQMGRDFEARGFLERALSINRRDSRAKRSLVSVLSRMGLLNEALEIAYDEVRSSPSDTTMWDRIIVLHLRMGNYNLAEEAIDELIWKNGGSMAGYVIAILLATEFQLEEKRDEIENHAVTRFGKNPIFYEELGRGFSKLGEISKQYRYLREGEKIGDKRSDSQQLNELDRVIRRVSVTFEDIEDSLEAKEGFRLTELVIKRIIQRSCVRKVNTEWEENKSIAMVSSSLGRGGAERQVVACLDKIHLDSQWDEVRLYCNRIDSSGGRFDTFETEVRNMGIQIDEIGFSRGDSENDSRIEDWMDLLNLLPNSMKNTIIPLFNRFLEYKPSIVHSWQDGMNIDAAIAALMAGVPRIILFARSMRTDEKSVLHMRRKRYLRSAYRDLINNQRVLLAHNSEVGSTSYSEWLDLPGEKFEIIHNGVNFDSMEEGEKSPIESNLKEFNIPLDSRIVGGVFRLVEEKQPRLWADIAAEIVSLFDDVHFVIVGGGQMLDVMRDEIANRGMDNRIHLVGQKRDVASWLKRMDLFLLTSRIEGLPNVLIEAQGFGVPVISTNAGGSVETFVDHETGRLSRKGTKEDLIELVSESLEDEKWLEEASKKAKENSRKIFSVESMYSRLKEIYEEAIRFSLNEARPVVSTIGTCRLYLPMRKMSEEARLVINNSGFETSYLHSLPEIGLRIEVLKGEKNYSDELLKFQCSEAIRNNIPNHFAIGDSDILLVEVSSLKTALTGDKPLQLNNVIRELCDGRGEEGKKLRKAIDKALSRNGEIDDAEFGEIDAAFTEDEMSIICDLKLKLIEEREVVARMKEISDLSPIPVVFLKHINVEGSDGKIILMRDLLSSYMDGHSENGLDVIDPTPLVIREGREKMLKDNGSDVNHYSEFGLTVIGNWMVEEIERRISREVNP